MKNSEQVREISEALADSGKHLTNNVQAEGHSALRTPHSTFVRLGILDWVVVVFFVSILIIVLTAVFFRYVIGHSLPWSDEVVRYLFVQFTLLGIALALRDRQHIRVEFFVEHLPPRLRKGLEAIGLGLVIVFNALLVVFGMRWVFESAGSTTPALGLPLNWVLFAALPVSALFALGYGVRRFVRGEYAELEMGAENTSEGDG